MTKMPFRTNATGISSDELLLLDFLFDAGSAMELMRREAYGIHMNVRYTHAIEDADLSRVLRSLVERGLLRTEPDALDPNSLVFRLSDFGGVQWTRERLPVWGRYCTSFGAGDVLTRRDVICADRAVGSHYLRVGKETGYMRMVGEIGQVQWQPLNPGALIYWKPVQTGWTATLDVQPDDPEWAEWEEWNAARTWWSSIEELQTFLPQ